MIALEVSNLVHRYTGGHESLRGISFQVEEGECVGLIGPNGAGKSTLLLHLNGILPERESQHSSIRVLDREVTTQNLAWIRRNVGLLFQDPDDQLFCPTVFDDVAFGPEQTGLTGKELAACVAGALAQVGLTGQVTDAAGSAWPAFSPATHACSCSTNRPATSTPARDASCATCCGGCRRPS